MTEHLTRQIEGKEPRFYERVSPWLNYGSEYSQHHPRLLVLPGELIQRVFEVSETIIRAIRTPEYAQFQKEYDYFIPKPIRMLKGLPQSAPPAYLIDWALVEVDGAFDVRLVELNECAQDSLTVINWTRALLETAEIYLGNGIGLCCNDEEGFIEAFKQTVKNREILWLSFLGHECNLISQQFRRPIVLPWHLCLEEGKLVDQTGRQIGMLYSNIYYPICLPKVHGRGLDCLKGSVIDSITAEELLATNVDFWPTFTGVYYVSKLSLPFLSQRHPELVPESYFVSEFGGNPSDYVLKPLFSQAGRGVNPQPTREDIEKAHPRTLVMRRIDYAPAVVVPGEQGRERRKLEVRCIAIESEDGSLQMHCGQNRLMKPEIFFSNPHHNRYDFGGVIHSVSLQK